MTQLLTVGPATARAPRQLAALCDAPTREIVAHALAARGGAPAEIIDGGIDAAAMRIAATEPPELVIIDLDASHDIAASIAALADVCAPETAVIALGSANDIALYRQLCDAGVRDYLVKPVAADTLSAALDAATAATGGGGARIVAMIGARGGVGATALALSAGWTLAQAGARVVLLDLDLHFGAMALALDTVPAPGLRDLLASPDRVDATLIDAALVRIDGRTAASTQLALLAGEVALEAAVEATPAGVAALLAALSRSADTIIVELPRQLGPAARDVLRTADQVAIITDYGLAALRDTQRLVRLAAGLRAGARPLILANRTSRDRPGQLARAAFEKALGIACDVEIAEDAAAAHAAAAQARPLSAVARDAAPWRALAALLGGGSDAGTSPIGFWQRLRAWAR